jgi:hypothetical protein
MPIRSVGQSVVLYLRYLNIRGMDPFVTNVYLFTTTLNVYEQNICEILWISNKYGSLTKNKFLMKSVTTLK